jgi:hypothetical protein
MRLAKTAYQLSQSQVSTPPEIVSLFWKIVRKYRRSPGQVLDLGAGDGRFARGGTYTQYDGVEIDHRASKNAVVPSNAKLHTVCAFRFSETDYDICLGNPPYVRHHDIERPWRKRVAKTIGTELGVQLSGIGNLYLYFLCLGLMKTHKTGLVALLIPFEWASRPSAKPIRDFIRTMGWHVSIYRFEKPIFDTVLTTASIVVIDKSEKSGEWEYFDIGPDFQIKPRNGTSGSRFPLLPYTSRGRLWARRGISPGGQDIFTFTEAERIRAGLHLYDVVPCITSLRLMPRHVTELNWLAFNKHFVTAGARCWLINSTGHKISDRVKRYLTAVPKSKRQTYACLKQSPWYRYENPQLPRLIFHSGFMKPGPKVILNSIGAQVVGSVYGIHSDIPKLRMRKLREYLARYDFERRIVAHAKTLRKVEVAQLNGVLRRWRNR